MSAFLTHGLIVAAYGLASAAAGIALGAAFGWSGATPWLAGGGVFLLVAQGHAIFARFGERAFVDSEFADLRRSNIILSEELEQARTRVGELSVALERESEERKRVRMTDRKVLEELVDRTLAAVADANRIGAIAPPGAGRLGADEPERPASGVLRVIRDAVEQNRIDVYLQPIVSLPQRKLRFYEAFTRLRDQFGEELPPAEYIPEAEKAGLISSIDSLLTFRCVQILRRLTNTQKDVGIFCNLSPYTIRDLEFFPQFLDYLARNRDLRNHLIFELSQDIINNAMDTEERHIARLNELGFQLSVDRVASLQLDLVDLQSKNVRYVKVAANTLIGALRAQDDPTPDPLDERLDIRPEDFKDLLQRYRIDLIAEKLESEAQVVEVLDLQVDYGQGYLLGAPKLTGDETSSRTLSPPEDEAPLTRLAPPPAQSGAA